MRRSLFCDHVSIVTQCCSVHITTLTKANFMLFLGAIVAISAADKCTTPNNEHGECIPLRNCSVLMDVLATRNNTSIDFLRQSNCGYEGRDPLVCCASTSTPHNGVEIKVDEDKPLSDKSYCGIQEADSYPRTGNETRISEFPWLAALTYRIGNVKTLFCSGSLINSRYVLTAGQCGEAALKHKTVGVRLGEYNVNNNTDCVGEDPDANSYECSNMPEDVGIEDILIHPAYGGSILLGDIALVKLNRSVTYSSYIRPICLPTPGTKLASPGDTLTASGWGITALESTQTEIKKKILAKLIAREECVSKNPYIKPTDNIICTRELETNTEMSCLGDGGGPVMFSRRGQWHQEGIFSSGAGCKNGNAEIHTEVANYLKWIAFKIEL